MKIEKPYEPAVSDRPADDAPSVTLCTDCEGEDLGGVQPRNGEPCGAELKMRIISEQNNRSMVETMTHGEREDEDHASRGIGIRS